MEASVRDAESVESVESVAAMRSRLPRAAPFVCRRREEPREPRRGARIALHNEDLLRSGCIKVDFCAGHEHDVTMDDELDEGDFDGSDDMGSGDEMDF